MPYVYILKSSLGRYYIGSTGNLNSRVKHHQGGFTHSTKRMGKLTLIFSQEYSAIDDARYVERCLKKLKRKDYIEKIIQEGYIRITPP